MKRANSSDQIFTITQAKFAELVGVTLPTVRAWVARGHLPTVRIGRRRLVDLKRYEQQIEEAV